MEKGGINYDYIVRYFNKKLLNDNFSTLRELTNCGF